MQCHRGQEHPWAVGVESTERLPPAWLGVGPSFEGVLRADGFG
jgi:hypothetical protein